MTDNFSKPGVVSVSTQSQIGARSHHISLASSPNWQENLKAFGQNGATLILLFCVLPINLLLTITAILLKIITQPFQRQVVVTNPQTILISGGKMTKALLIARRFHAAGHRVILIEAHKYWLTGHRFSQAVSKFYTVPTPEKNPTAYTQALLDIVKQEQVDVYIPVCSPVASYYDALVKSALREYCQVFHCDADVVKMLDDKFAFAETARKLGLSVPQSFLIVNPQQVINFDFSSATRPYILKSIRYDSVRRLDLTKLPCATPAATAEFVNSLPISPENPWIMQEFIPGQEYCTHSTVKQGELRMHCTSKSSAFQVNYENIDHPEILNWVSQFVKGLGMTGQVSFDFIESTTGEIYAIECNPRTHSAITMFYNHPQVADAYLDSKVWEQPIQPLLTSKPTYWLYHEIWRFTGIRSFQDLGYRFKVLWTGVDAIYSINDPLPFLMVHHWQIPLLLWQNLRKLRGWIRIDFNIGKLVELGGD